MKFGVKILITILAILFIITVALFSYQYYENNSLRNLNKLLRKEIVEKDSIEQIREGLYKRIVNDLYSSKELQEELKISNEKLYSEVEKYKVLYYGQIETKESSSDGKPDEVYLDESAKSYVSFYPDNTNPFIKHTLIIDSIGSQYRFNIYPFKLSYTIVEDEIGLQRIYFDTPDWLLLNDIPLQSLSKSQTKELKNWSIYLGAGIDLTGDRKGYGKVTVQKNKFLYSTSVGKKLIMMDVSFKLY